ncbi:MAG: HEAT repeat domain-containing protein [Phycisphaerales bacterium]|nr:MAG: HEAT repeat domain-containing protein [Phycisphaerales bacterium]
MFSKNLTISTAAAIVSLLCWVNICMSASPAPPEAPSRADILAAVQKVTDDPNDRKELDGIIFSFQRRRAELAGPELFADFVSYLKHKDPQVQFLGAMGLGELKKPESVKPLSDFIKNKDFRAIDRELRSPRTGTQAVARFWDVQAGVVAINTLAGIGDRSVTPMLESLQGIRCLQAEWGGSTVETALLKLGSLRSLTRVSPADDALKRERAARAIYGMRDPNVVPGLMDAARDKGVATEVRVAALHAIGRIGSPGAAAFLAGFVDDPNAPKGIRRMAAIAAGNTRKKAVERPLERHAKDPNSDIRAAAFCGLVLARPRTNLGRWFALLTDANEDADFRSEVADMGCSLFRGRLREHRKELYDCLGASYADGRPVDKIRVDIWTVVNELFAKEPNVVLTTRSSRVTAVMREKIKRRIIRATRLQITGQQLEAAVDKAVNELVSLYAPNADK